MRLQPSKKATKYFLLINVFVLTCDTISWAELLLRMDFFTEVISIPLKYKVTQQFLSSSIDPNLNVRLKCNICMQCKPQWTNTTIFVSKNWDSNVRPMEVGTLPTVQPSLPFANRIQLLKFNFKIDYKSNSFNNNTIYLYIIKWIDILENNLN
jgi:hypothetical protein